MKKLQIISLAFLLLMCFCFAQCKKNKSPIPDNPYGLPNATQDGAWTMGCLINKKPWIPKDSWIHAFIHGDSLITINGETNGAYGSLIGVSFYINKGHFKSNEEHTLDSSYHISYVTDSTCLGIGGASGITNTSATFGSITITKLDTIKGIVSGLFNCAVPIPYCDTLNITNGRFDIPLGH